MSLVRLISWNRDLAPERARLLKAAGFEIDSSPLSTSSLVGAIRDLSPAVLLIDLDRLPAHGRAVAIVLRRSKSTRRIPIVFAGGAPEKIERTRHDLPDAAFTPWKNAARALKAALKNATADPVVPAPLMDQYAASSLEKKLGFKTGMTASLLAAPGGFEEQLAALPENVKLLDRLARDTQLALWFVRSRAELESELDFISARLPSNASLWIIYPKRTSRIKADFNQFDVRAAGLTAGLVDYKICAVDKEWSGLKFARRRITKTKTSARTESAADPSPKPAARKSKSRGSYPAD